MNGSICLANNILERAFKENIDISPMKLQKLLYILYKEYLKVEREKLFDETFEVWKYGPVLPSVYNEFKHYEANAIKAFALANADTYMTLNLEKTPKLLDVFECVWENYKNYDGIFLSKLTDLTGTAWDKAAKRNDKYLDDNDIIEELSFAEYIN